MRHNRSLIIRFLSIIIFCLTIIPLLANEKDDESKSENTQEKSMTGITHDSVLAIISVEFVRLEPIFKRGCFDCHSNATQFPWYYRLPLIKTVIERDINRARRRIDFSHGFPFGGTGSQKENLLELKEVLEEGGMPPWSYRLVHWKASPSAAEKDSIFAWIDRSLLLMDSSESPHRH